MTHYNGSSWNLQQAEKIITMEVTWIFFFFCHILLRSSLVAIKPLSILFITFILFFHIFLSIKLNVGAKTLAIKRFSYQFLFHTCLSYKLFYRDLLKTFFYYFIMLLKYLSSFTLCAYLHFLLLNVSVILLCVYIFHSQASVTLRTFLQFFLPRLLAPLSTCGTSRFSTMIFPADPAASSTVWPPYCHHLLDVECRATSRITRYQKKLSLLTCKVISFCVLKYILKSLYQIHLHLYFSVLLFCL